MKKIFTILLAGVSTLAIAQKKSCLSRSIDDDGQKLSVRISGTLNGHEIDIDKSIDVSGMSKEERAALRDELLSSIAEGNLDVPPSKKRFNRSAQVAPMPPVPPSDAPEPMAFSSNEVNAEIISSGKGFIKEPVSPDPKGFSKHVRYNSETGEMFIKYRFMKDGDEYIYEKSIHAAEKSEKERQRLIGAFESEIGLPDQGMDL